MLCFPPPLEDKPYIYFPFELIKRLLILAPPIGTWDLIGTWNLDLGFSIISIPSFITQFKNYPFNLTYRYIGYINAIDMLDDAWEEAYFELLRLKSMYFRNIKVRST